MNNNIKAILPVLLISTSAANAGSDNEREYALDRIEAFAKISNIVEYYHPSDSVKATNWEAFSKYGTYYIQQNLSQDFAAQLTHLFSEVAPHVTFNDYLTEPERLSRESEVAGWRNNGYPGKRGHYLFNRQLNTIKYGDLHTEPFLPQQQVYYTEVNGVYVRIPMLLLANTSAKEGVPFKIPDNVNIPNTLENPYFCFGNMSKVWGVMEHFGQYFHHIPVNWKSELRPLLTACLTQDGQKIGDALKYSLTKLQDNHIHLFSYDIPTQYYWPDAGFEMVEGKPILIYKGASIEGMEVGDELVAVDGQDIHDLIKEKVAYSMATEKTAKSKVLGTQAMLRANPTDTITLDVKNKDNQLSSLQLKTDQLQYQSYNRAAARYKHSGQAKHQILDNNIHYFDLSQVTNEELPSFISKLEQASGIIVDLRSYPSDWLAWQNFLMVIHDGEIEGPAYYNRISNHPDYEQRYVHEVNVSRSGISKVLNKPMVVLSSRYSVSRNEFVLAFFQNLNIPVVGEVTNGINGDVTELLFGGSGPNRMVVYFTGAEVRQADGSKLIGVGVQPDVLVYPTVEDIRNNTDVIKNTAYKYVESLIKE
ncbi:PDZ domain-containing protein [Pseudoalteromonas luteoviolacea]|uniref:S41 family peptidase n=1 Tax=Pseudoalteromonas luteoviolacea TaxID=43657 RepID=UPI001B37D9A4|nr:S41 family peptidase [Pseudoalteromonas luteoviolacea]MBQ4811481.1 PDZ domain-containing protein [Pseudoalteromonas luteoviolacea]